MGMIDTIHPPQLSPGMARTTLDGNGRLLDFSAIVPPADPPLDPPIAPEAVFRAARLDAAAFTEVKPIAQPVIAFDQWRAWKGPHPHLAHTQLQLEAAWWKGRVVRVQVLYPWQQRPPAAITAGGPAIRLGDVWIPALYTIAGFFVILLARRNWNKERADRQGAFRIGVFAVILQAVAWAGTVHAISAIRMYDLFTHAIAEWIFGGITLFMAYLALEPEIRARWPHAIVTWNRVLAGKWLDPQVWSDVLIGAAMGSVLWIFFKANTIFILHNNEPGNYDFGLAGFLGARHWVGARADGLVGSLVLGLFAFLTIFAMRHLCRREIPAALATALLFTLAQEEAVNQSIVVALLFFSVFAGFAFLLLRVGLVATVAAMFFGSLLDGVVLGTDWRAWYVPASLATAALLMAIAIFAFWRSLGGRELLQGADV